MYQPLLVHWIENKDFDPDLHDLPVGYDSKSGKIKWGDVSRISLDDKDHPSNMIDAWPIVVRNKELPFYSASNGVITDQDGTTKIDCQGNQELAVLLIKYLNRV